MESFYEVKKLFQRNSFSKHACKKAYEIMQKAPKNEQVMIRQLFESQASLCKSADELEWLHRLFKGLAV